MNESSKEGLPTVPLAMDSQGSRAVATLHDAWSWMSIDPVRKKIGLYFA